VDKQRDPVCWECGASLKDIVRPFSHYAQCPKCRAELHVCKQCVHYAPRYITGCKHEHADKVLEKGKANHCGFFLPRHNAFGGKAERLVDSNAEARAQLDALFDGTSGAAQSAPPDQSSARAELDRLFGLSSDETDREGGNE
jgi:hypothetical protein